MGRFYRRPTGNVNYGTVTNVVGSSDGLNTLGDNNSSSGKQFVADSGSVLLFATPFSRAASIPAGRDIIALRAGHHQRNGGIFGIYNGWPQTRLRFKAVRADESTAYKPDGYSDSIRIVEGPPMFKPGVGGPGVWDEASITTASLDIGSRGNEGPVWCWATEAYIAVVYNEPVAVPSNHYPANGATISTSSVNFSADANVTQIEQPVQVKFEVSMDPTFTTGVSSYTGGMQSNPGAGQRSSVDSGPTKPVYTNLGPGNWNMRSKGIDAWGRESNWSAVTTFTISHAALPVPTLVAPAAGSTVVSPYALRRANIPVTPSGERKVGVLFQYSKVDDFSSGVVAWANVAGGRFDAGDVGYDPKPEAKTAAGLFGYNVSPDDPTQYLSQGPWFQRARTVDRWGQFSAWSTVSSFTVTHKPVAANVQPKSDKKFDQNLQVVTWTLADPWTDDQQTAYRMIVMTMAGTVIQDTGKVNSSAPQAVMNVGSPRLQEQLKYTIQLWDLDGVPGDTLATNTFIMSKAPVITLPYPAADEQIITGQPGLSWSCAFARPDVVQKSYEIKFIDAATGVIAYQTGVVVSTATTWSAPKSILKNLTSYQIALTVTDSDDLPATLRRNFSTNFVQPAKVTAFVEPADFRRNGYVTINFPYAEPDAFFIEYRVYRRMDGETEWTFAGAVEDISLRTFRDWQVHGNGLFQYTVTQAADRYGSVVESAFEDDSIFHLLISEDYWLLDPEEELNNIKLYSVNADTFTDESERAEFNIIGRGRHVNEGTHLGISGSLTVAIRPRSGLSCRQQLEQLREARRRRSVILMRDPFGHVTPIAILDVDTERMAGMGTEEFGNITLPYKEVK